jgi:PAS domain S-box-containing protein
LGRERRTLLLALAVVTSTAVVDVPIGGGAVLVELLVAGPLVAALGCSPRTTGLVGLYALALAIPLGWANDNFGSFPHVVGIAVLGGGTALAVVMARQRSAREGNAAHLSVQYAVARIIADAETLEAATPRLLEAIGRPLGWELGHLWEVRGADALSCLGGWRREGLEAQEFERVTHELVFHPGFGLPGRVWESARPAWVPDVIVDPNFPRASAAQEAGLHGAIAFPVRSGTGVIAVIELFACEVRERDRSMLELTEALGVQIGDFIERLHAADAVRESEARKSAVLESALDCVITIDDTGRVLEFNAAAERTFGYSAEEAIGREMADLIVPPALRDRHRSALRRCVETGEGAILGRRIELTGMRSDGSEFPVELSINRIEGHEPPMFTGVVRDIADRKGAETEREELLHLEQVARLDATQARDELQAILSGMADAVTAQGPDGRLLFANEAAATTLGYGSSEELLAAAPAEIVSHFDMFDERGEPFPIERLPGRRTLAGENGAEAIVRFRVRATGDERWSAVKSTPILDPEGRLVMAINVIEDITAHKRSELAQRFLSESSRTLATSLDPEELMQRVARLAVPEIADWCAVDVVDPNGEIELVALVHSDPALVERAKDLGRRYPRSPDASFGVPNVIRTGDSELYEEISDEMLRAATVDEEHFRLVAELKMRSVMVVPMIARGRTFGAISFVSGPSGRRFDRGDVELAEELGRRCATAIDNARLYSERAYIAATLQQSLLPPELPSIPGIEAAARFRPSGEGNEVGGDFYDLFPTGPRGWTVVVGDVCGKGPDAAAVTALARYTLRAAAMSERLPSRSLHLLNEALLRQRSDRRFCTVAYAYLESAGAEGVRLGVASGGHPLPLLVGADGTVKPVGAPGTLLGVLPNPRLEDRALSLSPGDALVFYTDGVVEARGEDGPLGEERLIELLAACTGRGADAIASHVEEAAVRSHGGSPRDDIAVLVLRVTGGEPARPPTEVG